MTLINNINILTFHGIGEYKKPLDPGEDNVWVKQELFIEICKFATNRDDIQITFDDGNISDIEIAMAELLENNLTGKFFIVADRIGKKGYLNSSNLIEMKKNGMEIGLHGMYHRPWRGLTNKELDIELIDAKNKIEDIIGGKIFLAACPYGAYDRKVLKRLKELNFKIIYTMDEGVTKQENQIQHRICIYHDYNIKKISKLLDKIYSNRFYTLKRNIKSIIKRLR